MKKINAAIYLRTSTTEQNPENQLIDCKNYAQARGFNVIEVFREQLSAYKKITRPEYNKIMELARQGKIQHIIIWDLSRITRKGFEDLIKIIFKLDDWGVRLHSVNESFLEQFDNDKMKDMKYMILPILAWANKMESKLKSSRIRAAHKNTTKKWGRPNAALNKFQVIKKYNELKSLRKTAEHFGVSAPTISKIIKL